MSAKYVIVIPDGAADEPIEQFDGKTPLEAARTPNMDALSQQGRIGLIRTVPEGMDAGSDVAQMCLLGYDPKRYYTGRAPLEAAANDLKLDDTDWIFRCNMVTVSEGKMADHSAGHLSTEEGSKLVEELNEAFGADDLHFYPGVGYRHLAVFKNMDFKVHTFPPHDYIGTPIEKILPSGVGAERLNDLMARSQQLFAGHDINKVRMDLNENPVSSIWLWGQGGKTVMRPFEECFGKKGAVITAVDLLRGIAKLVDFDLIEVEGATGFLDTNYKGKGEAAIEALHKYDLVIVHVEAPDEASHNGNVEGKKKAIEEIDKWVVGPLHEKLQQYDSWRMLVLPDHPTPVTDGAHSPEPVPFVMTGTGITNPAPVTFSEVNGGKSGLFIEKGWELMEYFLTI